MLVRGPENNSYEEWLRKMALFCLKNGRLRGDLIILYNYLKGGCRVMGVGLYSQVKKDRMRGNVIKVAPGKV